MNKPPHPPLKDGLTENILNVQDPELQRILASYPECPKSALLPILWWVQEQSGGWIPPHAIEWVAHVLKITPVQVMEVATFHTLFRLTPSARHQLKICYTTPCWLRGADGLLAVCREKLGLSPGQQSEDGFVSVEESPCVGRCCGAPVIHLDDRYLENVSPQQLGDLLDDLLAARHDAGECSDGGERGT